jgi:predicted aconitase
MDSWGFKTVVTNSGKMAHYAPGHMQAGVFFKDTARCTAAAISGKVCE